jgi:hypothetical protein
VIRQERIVGLAPVQEMPRPKLVVMVKPSSTAAEVSPLAKVTAVADMPPPPPLIVVAQTTVQLLGSLLRRVRLRPPKLIAAV